MAVTWRLLSDEEARTSWDNILLGFTDNTPFQSYAWGEYQKSLGWEPCYWAAFSNSGEVVAMMLGLLRRYPFQLGLIWSEGGPVGDLSECGQSFQEAMRKTAGLKRIYCRFRCDREGRVDDAFCLNAEGWERSWFNLTSSFSMTIDLTQDESQLLASCDQTWRKHLRRAHRANLSIRQWLNPDVDEVLSVYSSMQAVKGLGEQHSREEVAQLINHFRRGLVLYRCDDEQGELVSLLGWVVFGDRAWAWFCATSEEGRNLYASYAIFWAMVNHCRRLGVQVCDLAGIDPVRNNGVYRFKKGTGALPIEYLGEWDWATSRWLRWLGNWAISRRAQLGNVLARLQKAIPVLIKPAATRLTLKERTAQAEAKVA